MSYVTTGGWEGFRVGFVGNVNGIVKLMYNVAGPFVFVKCLYMFRNLALARGLRSIRNGLCSKSVGVVQTVRTSVLSMVERIGVRRIVQDMRSTPR